MSIKRMDVLIRRAKDIRTAMQRDAFMGVAQAWGEEDVVPYAQSIAPVDTGEYRDGIGCAVNPNQVSIFAAAPHSRFVDEGTSTKPARPTLLPAIQKMRPKLLARVRAALKEML